MYRSRAHKASKWYTFTQRRPFERPRIRSQLNKTSSSRFNRSDHMNNKRCVYPLLRYEIGLVLICPLPARCTICTYAVLLDPPPWQACVPDGSSSRHTYLCTPVPRNLVVGKRHADLLWACQLSKHAKPRPTLQLCRFETSRERNRFVWFDYASCVHPYFIFHNPRPT